MGVIARQGLKYSIGSYVGILIGVVNLLYIYPKYLEKEEIGIVKFIVEMAIMVVPFVTLGANSVSIRFYPRFKDFKTGFLSLLFMVTTLGYGLFLLAVFLFRPYLETYLEKSEYAILVLPLVLIVSYSAVLSAYCVNFQRVALPNFINSVLPKLSIPILVFIYIQTQNIAVLYVGTVIFYFIMMLILFGYVYQQGHLHLGRNFSFLTTGNRKEMLTYAGYGILGRMSSVLATRLDVAMVALFLDFEKTGVYTIALLLANIIGVPQQSINSIAAGVLSQSHEKNDLENVKNVYYKSCINQLIAALFIFVGIWSSLDYLFDIMPNGEEFQAGKYVVFFIGLSKIIDAMTGVNTSVIGYSKYFRFNFYAILVMAVLNIVFNIFFIYHYGMLGAAMSTALSVFIFNLIKFVFIIRKFGFQPFNIKILYIILLGIGTYLITYFIPDTGNAWLDMFINSATIALIYPSVILYFKFSEDINGMLEKMIKKIKN